MNLTRKEDDALLILRNNTETDVRISNKNSMEFATIHYKCVNGLKSKGYIKLTRRGKVELVEKIGGGT